MENLPDIYPLTSLQIGDIQSYVSQAYLYFLPSSKRILILLDNRLWSLNKHSKSTQLWQLMVLKYRTSPFINTRVLNNNLDHGKNTCLGSILDKQKRLRRWFSIIDAAKWHKKSLFLETNLSKALHGFILFDVAWKDVRGINYVNELQTDASLSVEVKLMKKWEFSSPRHAMDCISSWFLGTVNELELLKNYLGKLSNLDIHQWVSLTSSKDARLYSTSLLNAFPEDLFYDAENLQPETDNNANDLQPVKGEVTECEITGKEIQCNNFTDTDNSSSFSKVKSTKVDELDITPTQFVDSLLLLRFSDCMLPYKLRQVIMSDRRLLRKLESGLPSWALFLQSYPLFCHLYRPWMQPLVRTLYVLISLATFVIAFYDLYKNVPLLKETVARICGPFFGYIEKWDMLSRIQYLGTMLFIQNFEKALEWFLMMTRPLRPMLTLITKPLMETFADLLEFTSPLWSACAETSALILSALSVMMESLCNAFSDFIGILFWPFEFLCTCFLDIVELADPVLFAIWEFLLIPTTCALAFVNYGASMLSNTCELLKHIWQSVSAILQLKHLSDVNTGAHEMSIWKDLWNDLFKQVFRATRSVINGFLAFFVTCNRHRLSIYNHACEFLREVAHITSLVPTKCNCHETYQDHSKVGYQDNLHGCEHCKRT